MAHFKVLYQNFPSGKFKLQYVVPDRHNPHFPASFPLSLLCHVVMPHTKPFKVQKSMLQNILILTQLVKGSQANCSLSLFSNRNWQMKTIL